MTTTTAKPFMGTEVPRWAENVAQHVIDLGHHDTTVLHTAQSHERVLFRLPDGTVLISNRGRGMTTLTPDEAREMALFLLGADVRTEVLRRERYTVVTPWQAI